MHKGSKIIHYALTHSLTHSFPILYLPSLPVETSGNLPVSRDTPSYQALIGVLWGGVANQLDYMLLGAGGSGVEGGRGKDLLGVGSSNPAGVNGRAITGGGAYTDQEFQKAMFSPLSNPYGQGGGDMGDDDDDEDADEIDFHGRRIIRGGDAKKSIDFGGETM